MGYDLAELVKETTSTTGATRPYALDGAVAGRFAIGDRLGNLDTAVFVVKDSETPPEFEIFEGTYNSTPDTVTQGTILASSNGTSPVTWPGSGSREIFIAFPARALQDLIDPAASADTGLVVKTAHHAFGTTEVVEPSEFLTVSNPKGIGGAITLGLDYLPLGRNGAATLTQRTMAGQLVLGNDELHADTNDFGITGTSGAGDDRIKFTRNADTDYDVQFGIGGSLVDALHESNSYVVALSPQTSAVGTAIDFAAPAEIAVVRKVEILFLASLDGSGDVLVQVGASGIFSSTNYFSYGSHIGTSSVSSTSSTSGFILKVGSSSRNVTGRMVLDLIGNSNWIASHMGASGLGTQVSYIGGGQKSYSTLRDVRLTATSGNAYDSGSVAVRFWGGSS